MRSLPLGFFLSFEVSGTVAADSFLVETIDSPCFSAPEEIGLEQA